MREIPVIELDLNKPEDFGNVAEKLTVDERRMLATDLIELIGIDDSSMTEWSGKAKGYLDRVDGEKDDNPSTKEQQGADEEDPPSTEMTLSAVIQFSARATDALLGEPDLIKASETGGEQLAAWVSSELRTKDPNWTLDTDPLVIHMAVTGLAWRKRDFDDIDKVFHSHFIPSVGSARVIINSNIRSVERAPRITEEFERYPYEIAKSIERKKWVDYEPVCDEADPQAPKRFYECDAWLDLDGDGMDEPWTFVISRDDIPEVVRIRPRWSRKTVVDTKDVLFFNPIRRFYPYRFLPDPKGGFLPMGFGKLLDRTEDAADRLLSSIIDTAKTESENGGVMGGSQFGVPDKIEVKNNRVTTIPTDGQPLASILQMWPVKSVSPGSVSVLEKIITLGDRLAGTLNTLENAPASMTATLAKGIIDSGQQVQSAVHRRMVASMTQEAKMFVQMADAYDMLPNGMQGADGGSIAVTADPAMATEMQRTAFAGILMEFFKLPQVFSSQITAKELLKTLRISEIPGWILPPQNPQASPYEKLKGAVDMMKQQNERIKVTGSVAVQFTEALKNMVEASGGMADNRAALLTMAQLEKAVKEMMGDVTSAGNGLDAMAQQPGDGGAAGLPPSAAGGGGLPVPAGAGSIQGDPSAGSGS